MKLALALGLVTLNLAVLVGIPLAAGLRVYLGAPLSLRVRALPLLAWCCVVGARRVVLVLLACAFVASDGEFPHDPREIAVAGGVLEVLLWWGFAASLAMLPRPTRANEAGLWLFPLQLFVRLFFGFFAMAAVFVGVVELMPWVPDELPEEGWALAQTGAVVVTAVFALLDAVAWTSFARPLVADSGEPDVIPDEGAYNSGTAA